SASADRFPKGSHFMVTRLFLQALLMNIMKQTITL
ncbi:MAG: hypothetical protein ACJA0X_001177, partial [Cyclobacteriaceae bacterium]